MGLSAFNAVRSYWQIAVPIIAAVAAGLAVVLPVMSLFDVATAGMRARLGFLSVRGGDLGLGWESPVQPPAMTQQEAVSALAEMLLVAAVATLAIAAVTILILSLARESQRSGDLGVHRAVGASRRILLGSALLEGTIVALGGLLIGGIAGLPLVRTSLTTWPGFILPRTLIVSGAAAIALGAAVVVGTIFPVVFPRRRIPEAEAHSRIALAPTALQLGISLIALTASALVARHAAELKTSEVRQSNLGAVFPISLPNTTAAERGALYARMLHELKASAPLDSVSLTNPGGLIGLGPISLVTTDCGLCSEAGMWLRWRVKPATHQVVSADTFRLLGVQLVEGRGITSQDQWDAPRVAVVSRSLAIREFQDGKAVGRHIRVIDDGEHWSTVVGVVQDPRPVGLGGALQPRYAVYLSVLQHPPESTDLLVRAPLGRNARVDVQPSLQASFGKKVAEGGLSESDLVAAEAAPLWWFARWLAVEGWAMLAISTIGTFALMRLWVQSLLGELGVRRAVGARRRQVLAFVLVRAAMVGITGVAIGVWFGPPIWGVLPTVMTGSDSWNSAIIGRSATLLVGSALVGALLPAWKATQLSPRALISYRE